MKKFKIVSFFLLFFFIIPSLSSCVSKKERCDQVAFTLYRYGIISNKVYQSHSVQNKCIYEWDTKCLKAVYGECKFDDNEGWRDCILDAESKQEVMACGYLYEKQEKFR